MLSRIFRDDVENKQANRKRQIDTLKVFNDKYVDANIFLKQLLGLFILSCHS